MEEPIWKKFITRFIIIFSIVGIIGIIAHIVLVSPVHGQTSWLSHTSNNCKLTIEYPPTWTTKERNGTAGAELIMLPTNLKAKLPALIFTVCQKYNRDDMATLNIYSDTFLYAILGSDSPHYRVVDYSHLEKNLIGKKDTDVFDVATANNTTNLKMEVFTVINGTMLYQFAYNDIADHFDSPEGIQIRNHIIKSIKFLP